ncbi:MAG: hypothetical protein AAFX40_02265 [Cyanobacteria bacterium J06639_1]
MAKRSTNKSKRRSSSTSSRTRSSKPAPPKSPDIQAASPDATIPEGAPSPDSSATATDEPQAAKSENIAIPVEATPAKSTPPPAESAPPSARTHLDSLETAIARGQDLLTRLEAARQDLDTKLQGWSNGDDSLPSQQEMTEAIDYLGKTVVQLEATVKAKADPQAIALNTESIVNLHDQVSQLERQFAAASENNPADDAIAPLQTQLNALASRLESEQHTAAEFTNLQSDLERLQAKVKKLPDARTAIAKVQTKLETQIEGLQIQLDSLAAEDSDLTTLRQDFDRRLNELSAQLNSGQGSEDAIATLRADFQPQIETLRDRLETIPDPSADVSGLQTDLSAVRKTLDRLAGMEYVAKADFEPWQQTLQTLQESTASLPDPEVVSANAAAIERLQPVADAIEELVARVADRDHSLTQQAEALAQLGPVVLDLQTQLAALETKKQNEIASLKEQIETLESNQTAFASRQTASENADAIAHLQTQLNILPDPSADIRKLQSRLDATDRDRADIQEAIATLQAHLDRKADLIILTDQADELAQLVERVESVSTTSEQSSTRLSELQAELKAIAEWKAGFGDQLSPAEMLAALDFLGQKITQYETELARLDSHAHTDVEEAIASVRSELSAVPSLADDLTEVRSQQTETATTTNDLTRANVELRALVETLSTRTADIDRLLARQDNSDRSQTELEQAIAGCQTEISGIADWKHQFGTQLSPAEMLEALDFLGQTITRYEPQLARKAEAEAVKLNTETLMGVQQMLSDLREQFQGSEENSGQSAIAIATLTQKLATAGHTHDRQAKELQTQAGEIHRLNAQLIQLQAQLAPEQLRRSLEETGWSPERITKVAKHMQALAQAQTTLRRWTIVAGCAALGAISLALGNLFGLSF